MYADPINRAKQRADDVVVGSARNQIQQQGATILPVEQLVQAFEIAHYCQNKVENMSEMIYT